MKENEMKYFTRFLSVFAVLFALWFFRYSIQDVFAWFGNREAVINTMQQAGIWGPAILGTLFVLQVFLAFIPGQALMIASGFLYGFWGGFLISWLSLVAGGEIAFILARRYGRSFAERWIAPAILARWDQTAKGQGIAFFAITLVMPLVPNDAMCYVAGLGSISRLRFSIANLLGRGLACTITSALGAFGGNIPVQGWIILIVLFVIVGLVWMILRNRNSVSILA
jgi:uncharacterized membrane protein YdjX (TVP38/TMEM64 family)